MRTWIIGAALTAAVAVVVAFVPRFTANRTETNRHGQLRTLHTVPHLPPCPMGDDLDAFLSRVPAGEGRAPLWIQACREQSLPAGRVIVVEESRAGFAACREQLSHQTKAACSLEETLAFLADTKKARSVARLRLSDFSGQPVIWITSQPLAWGNNLIREHRFYLILALSGLVFCWLMAVTARHARVTHGQCLAMRRTDGPNVPRWPEFWLLFILPSYASSLPVDYRDEYEERVESEGKAEADRWYGRIVYASSRELVVMGLLRLIPLPSRSVR